VLEQIGLVFLQRFAEGSRFLRNFNGRLSKYQPLRGRDFILQIPHQKTAAHDRLARDRISWFTDAFLAEYKQKNLYLP
jgi:hypothetical protein